MSSEAPSQPVQARVVDGTCSEHGPVRVFEFRGPWFRFDEAAAYVGVRHRCGCPNAKAFYNWRITRGVVARGNLVAKADIDRVLRAKAQV